MVDSCFVAAQSETRPVSAEPSTHLVFDCTDLIQRKPTLNAGNMIG